MNKIRSVFLTMLLIGSLIIICNTQKAGAIGTIYIRSDGTVDPETAPIDRNGDTYTFASNIYETIVVQRDNIVVDGGWFTLQGPGAGSTNRTIGFDLSHRRNVTLEKTLIQEWDYGIRISKLSSGNRLINNNLTRNILRAIFVSNSSENTISYNTIVSNDGEAIFLGLTNSTTIIGNNVSRNGEDGIAIGYRSFYNVITNNTVAENGWAGISLGFEASTGNIITGNNITNNVWAGVYVDHSNGNKFYHNNLLYNTKQFVSVGATNNWDNDYSSGGNYWNDHSSVDLYWGANQNKPGSDGINDEPYAIDGDNLDNYPLMSPYQYWSSPIPGDINRDTEVDKIDLPQLAAAYGSTPKEPNWNPNCDLNVDNVISVSDLFRLSRNYGKTGA